VEGINVPDFGVAEGQYARIKSTMKKADNLDVTRATVNGFNPQAIYPKYMIKVNGGAGDALVVSDTNKNQFFTGYTPEDDKPIKIPILVCDAQWDAKGNTAPWTSSVLTSGSFASLNVETGKEIIDPPLQGGGLYVSGTWEAAESDGSGGWINHRSGNLSDADLSIDPGRNSLSKVKVGLPAGVGPVTADTRITINNLAVKGAASYLGESFNHRILAVYNDSTELDKADFQNTIAHEIGHAFHQVIKGDPAGGVAGIPKHPIQKDLGQGNHCRYKTDKCVMYDAGPIKGSLNRYCEKCHPYLLVTDFSHIT